MKVKLFEAVFFKCGPRSKARCPTAAIPSSMHCLHRDCLTNIDDEVNLQDQDVLAVTTALGLIKSLETRGRNFLAMEKMI